VVLLPRWWQAKRRLWAPMSPAAILATVAAVVLLPRRCGGGGVLDPAGSAR
jgi:hypothetical protein